MKRKRNMGMLAATGLIGLLAFSGGAGAAEPAGSTGAASAQDASSNASAPVLIRPSELQGNIGAMVVLPVPGMGFVSEDATFRDEVGQLIFSDNPEYIKGEGVGYRGTASGKVRVYTYHANADTRAKYFPTWLINRGTQPVTVRVVREALDGPGVDYGYIGQTVLQDYFGPQTERTIVIQPGERTLIDPKLANLRAHHQALIHGIYDLVADGPIEVAITGAFSLATDPDTLPVLQPKQDGAGRGLFRVTERHVLLEVGDTPTGARLASGRNGDTWVPGLDQTQGVEGILFGNYGVVYHIDTVVRVSEPKRVRFFMSAGFDGGGQCPMAPAVQIVDGEHRAGGEPEQGLVVRVPKDGSLTMTRPAEAAFLGEIVVTPEQPRVLRLDFMPPGGSCLPGALIAWPVPMDGETLIPIEGLEKVLVPWKPVSRFEDPFDEETGFWEWSLTPPEFVDGNAVWAGQAFGSAFAGPVDGSDYAYEMRARLDAQGSLRIFVRSQHPWKGYSLLIQPSSLNFQRLEGTWDHTKGLRFRALPGKIRVGEWFTVRIEARGNRFIVLLNGEQVMDVTDPENRFPTGRVGFRNEYTQLRLDHASLSPLDEVK